MYLGGDSITAIGVVSRARNASINLSVQDVIRSKSILHLAQLAKVSTPSPIAEAETAKNEGDAEEPFALSPIQSMYLADAINHVGEARFNQSFTLSVPRRFSHETIKQAMDAIVKQQSMLRARFERKDGGWEQRTTKVCLAAVSSRWSARPTNLGDQMESSAYHFRLHHLRSPREMTPLVARAQSSLCIESGPVFSVDLFDVDGEDGTVILMVAHHLCVDMVSRRIIVQDLTQHLEAGALATETAALSFPVLVLCCRITTTRPLIRPIFCRSKMFLHQTWATGAQMTGPRHMAPRRPKVFSLDENTTELAPRSLPHCIQVRADRSLPSGYCLLLRENLQGQSGSAVA